MRKRTGLIIAGLLLLFVNTPLCRAEVQQSSALVETGEPKPPFGFWDRVGNALTAIIGVVMTAIIYAGVFFIGGIVMAILPPRSCKAFLKRIERLGLFLVLLLLAGGFFNALWSFWIVDTFYYSADFIGTDFRPFWPITEGDLVGLGDWKSYLIGISFKQLQMIWFPFALGTWAVTALLYFRVSRMQFMQIGWNLGE